jgi:diguanylate cyclase (GGDEF)-like protein
MSQDEIPTLASMFVDADALPSPPVSVLEVVRKSEDPDVTIPALAKLIELDVALAVQIVRMSNSALYAPVNEITTVERALTTLGLRSVRLLALSTSLKMLIPDESEIFDTTEIRRRMVVNGSLARRFAMKMARAQQDEAFLAGMLTGLGPVVLATTHPDLAHRLFAEAEWPDVQTERDLLGFSTNDITAHLIREWGLPEIICDAVESRTEPIAPEHNKLQRCMQLTLLAERVLCGNNPSADLMALAEATESELDFSLDETNEWLIEAEPIVSETAELLQFQFPQKTAYTELLLEATRGMQQLTMEANTVIVESTRKLEALSQRNDELRQEAETDALTGLPNRGMLDQALASRLEAHTLLPSGSHTIGLLMVDLDHFKAVNDTHGHGVGDDVLRKLGSTLDHQTRGEDLAARYGGEEFVVLLARANSSEIAVVAERLRAAIETMDVTLPNGERLPITASIGGALFGEVDNDDGAALLERADRRLYMSKDNGRNQATVTGSG